MTLLRNKRKNNMKDYTNDELSGRILKALSCMCANAEINEYAKEQVVMGLKKSGDRVTVTEFVEAINYKDRDFADISGSVLDEGGIIRDGIEDKCVLDFFNYQMSCIFQDCPMKNNVLDFDDDGLMTFGDDTGEYIKSCFPLFKQVIATKVEYDVYDLIIPKSQESIWRGRKKCADFLAAIKRKKLKSGANVSKYFKDVRYMPNFVAGLLELNGGKFILKRNDINDIKYKLALFSVFNFKSNDNAALMSLKCKKYLSENQ